MRNPSPRIRKTTPYKSELCLLFQKNKCYKGQNCHYAHSISELNSNRNGVNERKLCYWSFNGKKCPFGNRCQYLHKHEFKGVRNASLPINAKKDESKSEEYSAMSNDHMWFKKTRLCEKWERFGWCGYGLKCTYAHGQAELDAHTKKLNLPELETRTKKLQVKGPSWMGWSVEKIGRIYGDWIDSTCEIQGPSS